MRLLIQNEGEGREVKPGADEQNLTFEKFTSFKIFVCSIETKLALETCGDFISPRTASETLRVVRNSTSTTIQMYLRVK